MRMQIICKIAVPFLSIFIGACANKPQVIQSEVNIKANPNGYGPLGSKTEEYKRDFAKLQNIIAAWQDSPETMYVRGSYNDIGHGNWKLTIDKNSDTQLVYRFEKVFTTHIGDFLDKGWYGSRNSVTVERRLDMSKVAEIRGRTSTTFSRDLLMFARGDINVTKCNITCDDLLLETEYYDDYTCVKFSVNDIISCKDFKNKLVYKESRRFFSIYFSKSNSSRDINGQSEIMSLPDRSEAIKLMGKLIGVK